jgi:hypothetical protein
MMKSIEDTQAGGDFFDLPDKSDYNLQGFLDKLPVNRKSSVHQGRTVLAFYYEDEVIVAGDRSIIAVSNLMFERCEKVIPVDNYSLMAVAGVPAIAFEISRILSQYLEYYRRTQIRPMSLQRKIRIFSKLLKENLTASTSGITRVSPILLATILGKANLPSIITRCLEPSLRFFRLLLGVQGRVISSMFLSEKTSGGRNLSLKGVKKMRLSLP